MRLVTHVVYSAVCLPNLLFASVFRSTVVAVDPCTILNSVSVCEEMTNCRNLFWADSDRDSVLIVPEGAALLESVICDAARMVLSNTWFPEVVRTDISIFLAEKSRFKSLLTSKILHPLSRWPSVPVSQSTLELLHDFKTTSVGHVVRLPARVSSRGCACA